MSDNVLIKNTENEIFEKQQDTNMHSFFNVLLKDLNIIEEDDQNKEELFNFEECVTNENTPFNIYKHENNQNNEIFSEFNLNKNVFAFENKLVLTKILNPGYKLKIQNFKEVEKAKILTYLIDLNNNSNEDSKNSDFNQFNFNLQSNENNNNKRKDKIKISEIFTLSGSNYSSLSKGIKEAKLKLENSLTNFIINSNDKSGTEDVKRVLEEESIENSTNTYNSSSTSKAKAVKVLRNVNEIFEF